MASTAVVTPKATLSFPALVYSQARAPKGRRPVYSCSLLFDKKAQASAEYKAMQQACIDAAKDKFGPNVNSQARCCSRSATRARKPMLATKKV